MPLITGLKEDFDAPSLKSTILVGRQHIITQTRLMLQALFERGLQPENVYVLGKCYSTNQRVLSEMKSDGVHVLPGSSEYHPHRSYDEMIDEQTDDLAALVAEQSEKCEQLVVLDSGGHLIRSINQNPNATFERIVSIEQTSSGYNTLINEPLHFPVLNVARSPAKLEVESPWIADQTVRTFLLGLPFMPREWQMHKYHRMHPEARIMAMRARGVDIPWKDRIAEIWRSMRPKSAVLHSLIIGGGAIGEAVYDRLQGISDVFDIRHERSDTHPSKLHSALTRADIIIGCTGNTSVPHTMHKYLRDQAVLVSASSSDREFDAVHLRRDLPATTTCHEHSTVTIPSTGHRVHLMNQGFPLTFTGAPEIVPLEQIQLTAALLMSGVLDAHRFYGQKGIIDYPQELHPLIQEFIEREKQE